MSSRLNEFNFVTEELNVVNDFKLIPPTLTSPKEPVDVDEPVTLPPIVRLDHIYYLDHLYPQHLDWLFHLRQGHH